VQLFKLRLVAAFSMQINATELDAPFTGPPMPATIPLGYFLFLFACYYCTLILYQFIFFSSRCWVHFIVAIID